MIPLLFLEGNMEGLGFLIIAILFIAFGIPIILYVIGFALRSKGKNNSAKILFIIATLYILISLGICGSMAL